VGERGPYSPGLPLSLSGAIGFIFVNDVDEVGNPPWIPELVQAYNRYGASLPPRQRPQRPELTPVGQQADIEFQRREKFDFLLRQLMLLAEGYFQPF
jgi:hypothetical protein